MSMFHASSSTHEPFANKTYHKNTALTQAQKNVEPKMIHTKSWLAKAFLAQYMKHEAKQIARKKNTSMKIPVARTDKVGMSFFEKNFCCCKKTL